MTQINAYSSEYGSIIPPLPVTVSMRREQFVTDKDWRHRTYTQALVMQLVASSEPQLEPSLFQVNSFRDQHGNLTTGPSQYFFPQVGIHSQAITDSVAEVLRSQYNLSFKKIANLLSYSGESGARMAVNRFRARNYGTTSGYSYGLGSNVTKLSKTNVDTRRFGVELEFKDLAFYEAAEIITRVTGKHCHSTSYHGRRCETCSQVVDYSVWKVERDATVCETQQDSDGEDFTAGGEAISPVGFGEPHLKQIMEVMEALTNASATVNRQAGMHVHINMKDMTKGGLADFVLTWQKHEDFMFGLCAPSRKNNHYCEAMSLVDAENIANQFRHSGRAYGNRGALNITSYPKLGTFEIRMHQGTLNPKKMRAWVKLMLAFTQAIKEKQFDDLSADLSLLGKLTAKGFLDQEIGSYLFARHGHLAN